MGLSDGDYCDAMDQYRVWYESRIVETRGSKVRVHFLGWESRWDITVERSSPTLQPFHSRVPRWRVFEPGMELEMRVEGKWHPAIVEVVDAEGQRILVQPTVRIPLPSAWTGFMGDNIAKAGTHIKAMKLRETRPSQDGMHAPALTVPLELAGYSSTSVTVAPACGPPVPAIPVAPDSISLPDLTVSSSPSQLARFLMAVSSDPTNAALHLRGLTVLAEVVTDVADDKLDSLAVRFIPCAEWVGTVLEANMFHSLFAEYALLLFRKLSYPADNQVRVMRHLSKVLATLEYHAEVMSVCRHGLFVLRNLAFHADNRAVLMGSLPVVEALLARHGEDVVAVESGTWCLRALGASSDNAVPLMAVLQTVLAAMNRHAAVGSIVEHGMGYLTNLAVTSSNTSGMRQHDVAGVVRRAMERHPSLVNVQTWGARLLRIL